MSDEIKAVIWDMGGVLLRTEDQSFRHKLADEMNVSLRDLYTAVFDSESAAKATIGEISAEQHWDSVRTHFNLDDQQLDRFIEMFFEGDQLDTVLMDFIQSLRPKCITALLSNAWTNAREFLSQQYSLLGFFDYALFSAEIGVAKPDPDIYKHLLGLMSMEPRNAIFIDDMAENVEAARKLGIKGIQFRNREQVLKELGRLLGTHQDL